MKKNKEKIKKFLESLEKVPIITKACNECGLSRNTIYRWRNEDDKFREKMDKAIDMGKESIDDLANSGYYFLMSKRHWPSIKYHLTHSLTIHEKTIVKQLDAETMKLRNIINNWRDDNINEREPDEDFE